MSERRQKKNRIHFWHDNRGSAMAWVIMLMLVATIMLAAILPMAISSITLSQDQNHREQAYYTAKSVTDMVVDYIISNDQEGPGKQLIEAAKDASVVDGITFLVNGLDSESFGTCEVNVRYEGTYIYIMSTATYAEEEQTVGAVLQKEIQVGTMEGVSTHPQAYEGILTDEIASDIGSIRMADGGNGKPVLVRGAKSGAIVLASGSTETVPMYSNNGVTVTQNVTKGGYSVAYGGAILSNQDLILSGADNEYTVIPSVLTVLLADSTNLSGCIAYYSAENMQVKGRVVFDNPDNQPVLMKAKNMNLTGTGTGMTVKNNYHIEASENITCKHVNVESGRIAAGQQFSISCDEYGDGSHITSPINCREFVASPSGENGDSANGVSVIEILDVTADSVNIQMGDTVSNLHIHNLYVTGDVNISGKGITIDKLIVNGNATIGSYVAINSMECTKDISVGAYSKVEDVKCLGNMSVDSAVVTNVTCSNVFIAKGNASIDKIRTRVYQQFGNAVNIPVDDDEDSSNNGNGNGNNGNGNGNNGNGNGNNGNGNGNNGNGNGNNGNNGNGNKETIWVSESFTIYSEDGNSVIYPTDGAGKYSRKKNGQIKKNGNKYTLPTFEVTVVTNSLAVAVPVAVDPFTEVSALPSYSVPVNQEGFPTGTNAVISDEDWSSSEKALIVNDDKALMTLKVNSHGDTYVVVKEGKSLTVNDIVSDMYYGNLYFILEKNAKLTVGQDGTSKEFRMSVYGEAGSVFQTEGDCLIQGVIQNSIYKPGNLGTYRYQADEALSGVFDRDIVKWRLVQYVSE